MTAKKKTKQNKKSPLPPQHLADGLTNFVALFVAKPPSDNQAVMQEG